MNIYTLNVGQGQFVAVTGQNEAIIIDTYFPLRPAQSVINVKAALAKIFKDKEFVGLIISGFDCDHFTEMGMRLILNKYRPDWIMYPDYFKDTGTADACFEVIEFYEDGQDEFERFSIALDKDPNRYYNSISDDFIFELYSPHGNDMDSSNNCSIVCKITERQTGGSYLVTGDTESGRWNSIANIYGSRIEADVLAAPHHGSRNGITEKALALIDPHTVLISAGVNNKYGHPNVETVSLFQENAEKCYATCAGEGQSLKTVVSTSSVRTTLFVP